MGGLWHCFTMFYLHYVFMTLIFPGPEDREVFQDWTEGVPCARLAGDL